MIEFCRPVLRCRSVASLYEPCSVTLLPNHLFIEDLHRKLLSVHFDNVLFLEIQPHELSPNEHSLLIYLRNNFSASVTQLMPQNETNNGNFCLSIDDKIAHDVLPRIVWSWYHYQMSKAAGIAFNFEISEQISKSSSQTYAQTLRSLRESSLNDYSRTSRVFSSFAKKVMSSICLKELCLQHCDIFIVCKEMLRHLLYSPLKKQGEAKQKTRTLFMGDDLDDPLLATVCERMKLFHQILSALVAVFHGSSVIFQRDNAISELPGPFHISSWLDLLTVDVFERISQSLGLRVCRDYETIIDEVDKSIAMASRGIYPSSPEYSKASLTWNMSQSVVNSDLFRELGDTDAFTERVLTPLKSKAEYGSLAFSQGLSSSFNSNTFSGIASSLSSIVSRGNRIVLKIYCPMVYV